MSEEDTKVADLFDKDIENFGNDLDKMIEHLNIVIATHNKQVEEIERLNNIIKDIKSQLDYLETYSSKEDVFEDMKKRLDRIESIIGSDKE